MQARREATDMNHTSVLALALLLAAAPAAAQPKGEGPVGPGPIKDLGQLKSLEQLKDLEPLKDLGQIKIGRLPNVLEIERSLKLAAPEMADIVANLEATREWVLEQNRENLVAARAYLAGEGPFPERAALNQLGGRFLTDFYATVARWVEWAMEIVDGWPDDVRQAPFDIAAAEESLQLAESITSNLSREVG